jgi:hypothetical protein
VAGLALRDRILHGHKPASKCTAPDSDSSDVDTGTSNKENCSESGMTASTSFNSGTGTCSTSTSKGKRRCASTLHCSKSDTRFDNLIDYMQGQAEKRERFEQAILEEQRAGRVLQEHAMLCRLDIMQEGLLGPR